MMRVIRLVGQMQERACLFGGNCVNPLNKMKWIQMAALVIALCGCSKPDTKVVESGSPGASDLRVTLNLMASGYDLKIKMNGVKLGSLKPPKPEFTTVALQLFHEHHENKELAGEERAYYFCLREGENEMEVTYDLVDPDKVTSFGLHIMVISPTAGLSTPIMDFKQEEKKSGHFKVLFECYEKMPEGFKTVIPKVE